MSEREQRKEREKEREREGIGKREGLCIERLRTSSAFFSSIRATSELQIPEGKFLLFEIQMLITSFE